MVLNDIKLKKDRGFTIVELLVVIVVIAILAAITIVAYSGITNRAKTSKNAQNADSVAAIANTYAADQANSGAFPTAAQLSGYTTLAKLPSGITVTQAGTTVVLGQAVAGSDSTVLYLNKSTTTGACIAYWDFSTSALSSIKYVGDASASTNFNTTSQATCT
jgi:prepilin-type N-terminal cleavage/methylation domain-containing protein